MLRRFWLLTAAASLLLMAALVERGMLWKTQVDRTQSALEGFSRAIEAYYARHGRLPGDANGDGKIDDAESAHVARRLSEAKLIASGPTAIALNGRVVALSLVARGGRNVIELSNLPCSVAQELGVASCDVGGVNDPVPVVAVALPSVPGVTVDEAHAAGRTRLAAQ